MKLFDNVIDLHGPSGGVIENPCILVPEGLYQVRYQYYRTHQKGQCPKLEVIFGICTDGEHAGLPVSRWYNVLELAGPAKRYGDYRVAPRGDCAMEYTALMGRNARPDRVSHCALIGMLIEAEIRTVRGKWNGESWAEGQQYSVIGRLIRRIDRDNQ